MHALNDGRNIFQNLASLNILVYDVINLHIDYTVSYSFPGQENHLAPAAGVI